MIELRDTPKAKKEEGWQKILTDEGWRKIFTALRRQPHHKISEWNLSPPGARTGDLAGQMVLELQTIQALAEHVSTSTSLKKLSLASSRLCGLGEEGLFGSVGVAKQIKIDQIKMHRHTGTYTPEKVFALADALPKSVSLREVCSRRRCGVPPSSSEPLG